MPTLLLIALRNLRRNNRRTIITLAALLVGVSALVSVNGLVNGLQRTLIQSVTEGMTGAVQVHRRGYRSNVLAAPGRFAMTDDVLVRMGQVSHVRAVAGRIAFAAIVSRGDQTLFTGVMGVDPNAELAVCPERAKLLLPGSAFVGVGHTDGVILTPALARALSMKLDDEAAFLANDQEGGITAEDIHLSGLMALQWAGEKKIALAPLALAQRLMGMQHQITEAVASVDDLTQVQAVAAELQRRLGPDYEVTTWSQIAAFVPDSLAREDVEATVIAVSFMLLMLLGVGNTMLMSTLERTREMGTMMAFGMRRRKIVVMLLTEALVLGIVGAAMGSAAGIGTVWALARDGINMTTTGSQFPFCVRPFVNDAYILRVVLLAATGSVLFSLYPAWRATRMRPQQALAGR